MRRLLLALCLLAALGLGAWFYFARQPVVAVATVQRDTAVDAVPASVKVDPEFQVTITSDVAGLIRVAKLKIGQLVREGDVLFEIDPVNYQLELNRLLDQLENTRSQFALNLDQRAALARRKEDLDNFARRTQAGEYPEFEFKRRQEEYTIFVEQQEREQLGRAQQIAGLEYAIKLQRKAIAECTVKAPASGTVTALFAQPGEVVGVRAALVRLFSEALQVEARINEEDFSGIRPGLEASVRFLAYGPELYPAKVIKVLPNADEKNQQYRAFLEVELPPGRLIPGLSGEASIIRNRRTAALIVPRAALYNNQLFVVAGGVVQRRTVRLGFRSLNAIEILEGVREGETVALTALDTLADGTRVRVQ